jgi:atypical dual specificity phosphatase
MNFSQGQIEDNLNFSFVLPAQLAGMAHPDSFEEAAEVVKFLLFQNVHTIVNLSGQAYTNDLISENFVIQDEGVEDFGIPAVDQVDRIFECFLKLPGEQVMVLHCAAGIGRTGTVLACLIGRLLKLDGLVVIREIRKLRPGSIETAEQEEFIISYCR